MSWWLIPSIVGVIAAAVAIGLLISYIILRIRKRPGPFSREPEATKTDKEPAESATASLPDGTIEGKTKKSAALTEIENNLEIATGPATKGLVKYRVDVWNTRRSEFDNLDASLLGELTKAYVDMLLANNLVWASMELDQNSQNLAGEYMKLSARVAERLKRNMPAIREILQPS